MTRYLTFLLGTTIFLSCNNSRNTIDEVDKGFNPVEFPYLIDIGNNLEKPISVPLSSLGKELEYVPLETNERSLIGEINQIKLSEDYIFVYSNTPSKILQFDRKGKFVRQIGVNGRGPGEYIGIMGFCIDQKKQENIYLEQRCICFFRI